MKTNIALVINDINLVIGEEENKKYLFFIRKIRDSGVLIIYLANEIIKEVSEDICIRKKYDNGFTDTELKKILNENEIEIIIFCGAKSGISLETTATEAYFNEFAIVIVEDGICTDDKTELEKLLDWFKGYYATSLTFDEICRQLSNNGSIDVKEFDLP